MLTGELKNQIDRIWDAFWSGGISNPLEVIEQITYLLFLRRLDDLHTLEENKSNRLKKPMEHRVFPAGRDPKKRTYEDLRWSRFRHFAPAEMFKVMDQHVFPFLRALGGDDSTYAHHMKDARFTIPTPALLAKVVDLLADVPMEDRDTKGDLQQIVRTKKTELLFLALFLRLLKPGGRAAVIVPDGVLFGSSNAHKTLRRMLIEDQKLDAVISLPGGVFRPYAGVSTAILLFTKTNSGGTAHVWFYDCDADGWSLDDKRTALLSEDKLGAVPQTALIADEHAKNNLPDILARWQQRDGRERKRPRMAQSFCVPKADLVAQGYDLSLNRYKEVVHEDVQHRTPQEILADLASLETEIQQGMKELTRMLE